MHYHLIPSHHSEGHLQLPLGELHATLCSDLIGFAHHTQTATVQVDRRVGHTLITPPQTEGGYRQEELETRLYYLPGFCVFFRSRTQELKYSVGCVESDTWGIVSRGVLLTCWSLTATHGELLRDVGQLSYSLDPPAETLSICTHFRKAMLLLFRHLSQAGADYESLHTVCLCVIFRKLLSLLASLILFVYHKSHRWPEERKKWQKERN